MTYRVGDIVVQGDDPSNIIHAVFGRPNDDGKARILRRRVALSCSAESLRLMALDVFRFRDDLTMDHAAPEDTRPVADPLRIAGT
jgi:hypothetical protein